MTWYMWLGLFGWGAILAGGLWFGRKLAIYKENQAARERMLARKIAETQVNIGRVAHFTGMKPDDSAMEQITGILSDPAMLDAELERSAELSEARLAKRRNLRQPNAGPPAKVSRMRFHRN